MRPKPPEIVNRKSEIARVVRFPIVDFRFAAVLAIAAFASACEPVGTVLTDFKKQPKLDPWETPESMYYGAALAALATGIAPADYQARPEIRQNVAALTAYLRSEQAAQPLHNRLTLLWASTKLRDLLASDQRAALLDEVWGKQQADGGWTLESLGAFKKHPEAPPSAGSNGYATALVAFTVQTAGTVRSNPGLAKALAWLRAHQDQQIGDWSADSMNKQRDPDSMPARFMRDAATGFATLALLEAGQTGTK